jgi:septum formation protein
MPFILASASPRRAELLRNAGIEFTVQASNISEEPQPGEDPTRLAKRLALEKARAVFRKNPGKFVLSADTIVVIEGQMLAKPQDANDAVRMLSLLSGRTHEVITGVCLAGPGNVQDVRAEKTGVTFNRVEEDEIRAYVATGDPMDKAGGYGIQGMASRWIPQIEGDYFNVVGLPVALVWKMLCENGVVQH